MGQKNHWHKLAGVAPMWLVLFGSREHLILMQFQVTEIEFDFTDDLDDEALDVESQDEIYDEVLCQIWEADDEEDLVEEITCAYCWCIKSIDYRHILK